MARRTNTNDFHFEGFDSPNTTPVPDVVFDRLLAKLGEAELKALLYIIRRTFGFKRDRDPISFNQFLRGITTRDGRVLDEGCGVRNRTTLSTALRSLEEKGIVVSEKGTDERGENVTTVYRLRFRHGAEGAQANDLADERGVVRQTYHRGTNHAPPVVRNSYPQETGLQETDIDPSKFERSHDHVDRSENGRGGAVRRTNPSSLRGQPAAISGASSPGFTKVAKVLRQRAGNGLSQDDDPPLAAPAPGRTAGRTSSGTTEEREKLFVYLRDFGPELGDEASLPASITQVLKIFHAAGVPPERWDDHLYRARTLTQERTASIKKQGSGATGVRRKNKFPYFKAVLRDLVGLKTNERPTTRVADHRP
jgi:hypothetical protein